MTRLYIVGTVHIDPDGKEKLDKILEEYSPSVIAVEFDKEREKLFKSPYEKEIKSICNKLKLSQEEEKSLREIISLTNKIMGYEFKSPKEYVKTHPGTRMEYIDTYLEGRILPLINSFYDDIIKNEDDLKQTLKNYKGPAEYIENLREYTKKLINIIKS